MTPETKVRVATERVRELLAHDRASGAPKCDADCRGGCDRCKASRAAWLDGASRWPDLAADLRDARAEVARLRDDRDATSHALDDARARLDDVADAFELPRAWDGEWGDRVRALVAAGGAPALSRVTIARACRDTAARIAARMGRALDGPTTRERAEASVWAEVANLIESGREGEYSDDEGDAEGGPTP